MYGVCIYGTQLWASSCESVFAANNDLQIIINGQNKTNLCVPETFSFRSGLNRRATGTIKLVDRTNSYRPPDGASIIILKNTVRIFAGTIEKYTETMIDGNPLTRVLDIKIVDHNQILDKRVIVRNFQIPGQRVGDIVRAIIDEFLFEEGITAGTIEDGVEVDTIIFNYRSASRVMDQLAQLTGMSWFIDSFKNLNFVERTSLPATITLTDADQKFRKFKRSKSRDDYSNFIYLRGGTSKSDLQNESFVGDGARQTFTIGIPFDQIPTVEVNGVPQSVGTRGVDDETAFQWFFQTDKTELTQRETDSPLVLTDTLDVAYIGRFPLIVVGQLNTEIAERAALEGNSGKYEHVEDNEDIDDRTLATDTVAALLRRFGEIPEKIKFQKDNINVRVGQIVTINVSEEEVAGDFLVTDVVYQEKDQQGRSIHTVTVTSGELVGSWVEWFRRLKEQGTKFAIGENELLEILRSQIETVTTTDTVDFITSLDDGTNDPYTGLQTDSETDDIEFAHFVDQINVGKDQP